MEVIEHYGVAAAPDCRGTAVVIDVLRAFTTLAYAFGAGVQKALIVGSADEAFAWRQKHPDCHHGTTVRKRGTSHQV